MRSLLRRLVPRHLRRARADRDLDAEIQAHLAIDAQTRIEEGASREAAWTEARRDFGNVPLVKETTREAWGGAAMERLIADVREGLRRLVRQPTFTAAIVTILALGIGTTVAALSVINAAFLKRLPVDAPHQLVYMDRGGFSYPIFREVEQRGPAIFASLFAWKSASVAIEWQDGAVLPADATTAARVPGAAGAEPTPAAFGETSQAQALFVTEAFYQTVRLSAARGRLLDDDDHRAAEGLDAIPAVISDDSWARRFDRDPAIVGRRIRIEGVRFTIVGVTPPGFSGIAPGLAPEITAPLTVFPALKPQEGDLRKSGMAWLQIMGRLRPGLSPPQADAAFQTFWPEVMRKFTDPTDPPARRAQFLARPSSLRAGDAGFSPERDRLTRPLFVLLGLVSLFLLVGCASVASLLLVRGVGRQREMAIRLALGGTRGRIARQLLVEGVLFALLATAVAAVVAHWSAEGFVALLSTPERPLRLDLAPDARVVTLTLIMAMLTAVIFSVAPGLQVFRIQPGLALKTAAKPVREGLARRPLGKALVIVEVALATLLLAGAALLTRSVQRLLALDPGFEVERLLVISLDDPAARQSSAGGGGPSFVADVRHTLQERLRAVPGVDAVGFSWKPPVSGEDAVWSSTVTVDRSPTPLAGSGRVFFNFVSPGYFAAVGQTLRRGRDFTPQDQAVFDRTRAQGPAGSRLPPPAPTQVQMQAGIGGTCIISEALARLAFPNQDPIGRTIGVGRERTRQALTIVGVVEDAKYQRLQEETRPIAYLPLHDGAEGLARVTLTAVARTRLPPPMLVEAVRREIRRSDPALLVRVEPLADRVRDSLVAERMMATLSVVAGALALFLASTGLYGLLAYTVSSRTGEIGVRMALGARASSVRWMVLRDSLRLAGAGLLTGLIVALALGRAAAGWLYELTPADRAGALAVAATVTFAVIVGASLVPAWRASRVDPLAALRHE